MSATVTHPFVADMGGSLETTRHLTWQSGEVEVGWHQLLSLKPQATDREGERLESPQGCPSQLPQA